MKKVALMVFVALALTGCSNTLDGFGQDMERAGKSIQKTF